MKHYVLRVGGGGNAPPPNPPAGLVDFASFGAVGLAHEPIVGPQVVAGNGTTSTDINPWPWHDSNMLARGAVFAGQFTSSDQLQRDNQYDQALAHYITYYRTGDPAWLTRARTVADHWWANSPYIQGGNYNDINNMLAPMWIGLSGLMLRALDGRPEMWPWIQWWANDYGWPAWLGLRLNNSTLWYGIRDGGFMLKYAALLAIAHPDAATRATWAQRSTDGAVQYFARLQHKGTEYDGSSKGAWVWDSQGEYNNYQHWTQPWMMGLVLEGLVEVHKRTGSATVLQSILDALDCLWGVCYNTGAVSDYPSSNWRAVYYGVSWDTGSPVYWPMNPCGGDFPYCIENNRAANCLGVHAFGYAYRVTGNAMWLARGDEMFASSFGYNTGTHPLTDQHRAVIYFDAKLHSQGYRTSGQYLAWRLMQPIGG
jgi:hypothetical protein